MNLATLNNIAMAGVILAAAMAAPILVYYGAQAGGWLADRAPGLIQHAEAAR